MIITVCPSCYKVFKETAKNQKVIAYWDLMKNLIGIPETARGIGIGSDVVFNIHDSCVTRDETSHHESVRWVLDELGYNWTEIERNGKTPDVVALAVWYAVQIRNYMSVFIQEERMILISTIL